MDLPSKTQINEAMKKYTIKDASVELKISLTKLKHVCREYGIKRWAYRYNFAKQEDDDFFNYMRNHNQNVDEIFFHTDRNQYRQIMYRKYPRLKQRRLLDNCNKSHKEEDEQEDEENEQEYEENEQEDEENEQEDEQENEQEDEQENEKEDEQEDEQENEKEDEQENEKEDEKEDEQENEKEDEKEDEEEEIVLLYLNNSYHLIDN